MKKTIYVATATIHPVWVNRKKLLPAVFLTMLGCYAINSSAQNTKLGTGALQNNTTGTHNTAIGAYSMNANTTGSLNVAIGRLSLSKNTTASYNTAIGSNTLSSNTTGWSNTASGYSVLYFNTTGNSNTVSGHGAMYLNTTGSGNTASGRYSMYTNTTGSLNTASGYGSMQLNTTGSNNTTGGFESMYSNTSGGYNTASGYRSLYSNTTGFYNTACGSFSLYNNTTGSSNKADGYQALYNNTTGSFNTGLGRNALYSNTTGTNNTALGFNANVSGGSLTNATAIGANAMATASNQIMLGNSAVTVVRTFGSIIWASDGRFKKNVKENVPGLEFIKRLKPLTYTYDVRGLDRHTSPNDLSNKAEENSDAVKQRGESVRSKEQKVYTGFIAQEVEATAKKLGYDFSGVYKPQNEKDIYGLSYAEFVVPLVKAVQELSMQNEDLQKRIEKLESMNNASSAISSQSKIISINEVSLEQNTPNPFTGTTSIRYSLPQKFTTAHLLITDKSGKTVKQVNIQGNGKGSVNIDAALLSSGTYNYSLIVDGRIISSKQMVLTK